MQAAASLHPKPGCPRHRDSHSCGVGGGGHPRKAARATGTGHSGPWGVSTSSGLTWLRSSWLRRSAPGWEGIAATRFPRQRLLAHLPLLWLCHGTGCGESASQPQPWFFILRAALGLSDRQPLSPGAVPGLLQPPCCSLQLCQGGRAEHASWDPRQSGEGQLCHEVGGPAAPALLLP